MHDEIQHSQDTLTLLDLREKYRVNILELAERSGGEPSVVYCMLLTLQLAFTVFIPSSDYSLICYSIQC